MASLQLSGKDLRAIGYPQGPVISLAINTLQQAFSKLNKREALELLRAILQSPNQYADDEELGKIAKALLPKVPQPGDPIPLQAEGVSFSIYGEADIEPGALLQMRTASKLPISVAGALMPDAHQGYGLPIGGVLATEGAVIPYGVGVDIGCRMCLSVFDVNPAELESRAPFFTRALQQETVFGAGGQLKNRTDNEVLYDKAFGELPLLRSLHDKARAQLGTSGSGNHFVEWGVVEVPQQDDVLAVPPGTYLGLLSHSGSRGLGAAIANHYTATAKAKRKLSGDAQHLAWLRMDEAEGAEYWMAMNLAGNYASACHHVIHEKMAQTLGRQPLRRVENHHNFAWKEQWNGKEVIVHRKGATPAGIGVLGIIPGSMTAPGFIVKGKGTAASLYSASHGAGRRMSRTAALKSITHDQLNELLRHKGVKLLGGGLDEAPFAYKDIHSVMKAQEELVETVGLFYPKIVRMDG